MHRRFGTEELSRESLMLEQSLRLPLCLSIVLRISEAYTILLNEIGCSEAAISDTTCEVFTEWLRHKLVPCDSSSLYLD